MRDKCFENGLETVAVIGVSRSYLEKDIEEVKEENRLMTSKLGDFDLLKKEYNEKSAQLLASEERYFFY